MENTGKSKSLVHKTFYLIPNLYLDGARQR